MTGGKTRRELEITVRLRNAAEGAWRRMGQDAERAMKTAGGGVKRVTGLLSSMWELLKRNRLAVGALSLAFGFLGVQGVRGLVDMNREMSRAAASAEELDALFGQVFGELEDDASSFADALASGLGRGRQEMRKGLADFQAFFSSLQLSEEAAFELAKSTTQLGLDLASAFNQEDIEALTLLRSGLIGNGEALDRFNARVQESEVQLLAQQKGLLGNNQELTNAQKALLRLELIYTKVGFAQGDALRTADSFTNRMKGLKGEVQDLQVEFGQRLNTAILQGLDDAGGADKVLGLVKVFFATVAEFGRVGIATGAELARMATEAIAKLGGPQGFVEFIQRGGEAAVLWIKAAGAEASIFAQKVAVKVQEIANRLPDFINPFSGESDTEAFQRISTVLPAVQGKIEQLRDTLAQVRRNELDLGGREKGPILASLKQQIEQSIELVARYEAELEALKRANPQLEGLVQTYNDLAEVRLRMAEISTASPEGGSIAKEGAEATKAASAVAQLEAQYASFLNSLNGGFAEASGSLDQLQANQEQLQRSFRLSTSNQLADFFLRIGDGAQSASDKVRNLANSILYTLLQGRLARGFESLLGPALDSLFGFVNPLTTFSAKGNAFFNGQVQAFAKGGLPQGITQMPIAFGMKGGMGIAGEAGREAIMPVQRMPSGNLGVEVSSGGGGGQVNVALTVNAIDSASFLDVAARDVNGLGDLIAAAIARNRNVRAVLNGGA